MAARTQFIIPKITHDFEIVTGTVISEPLELFAHKSDSSWVGWIVSDIKSGCMIECHFKTLDACKEYAANLSDEMIAKINAARQKPEYKELCELIKAQAESGKIKNKFYEMYTFEEAFDMLNDRGTQLGLFDLEPPVDVEVNNFSDALTKDLVD